MRLNTGRLPKGFVLAKPIAQEGYDESVIYELERKGRLIITRKRDGWKMFAVVGPSGKVRLFTDGLNEIDSRLDHIKKELKKLNLPTSTVLVGEAIVDLEGNDDIGKVISIFHSNTEKSIQFQKTNGRVKFMIFEVIWPDRKPLPYSEILININNIFWPRHAVEAGYGKNPDHVVPVQVLKLSFDKAKEAVVVLDEEGLVLYDKDYVLTYRTDGKVPKRPEGCYKWKPIWEDDFIVRLRLYRSGTDTLKELVMRQIDPTTGKEFICGKLGTFTNQMRQDLAKMKLPLVVQAAFEMRFPKSGKIRNARFIRVRDDKPVEQCVSSKSYPEADYPIAYIMGYCKKCEMTVDFYQDGGGWSCERCGHWVDEVTDVRED